MSAQGHYVYEQEHPEGAAVRDALECTRRKNRRHIHKLPAAGIAMHEMNQTGSRLRPKIPPAKREPTPSQSGSRYSVAMAQVQEFAKPRFPKKKAPHELTRRDFGSGHAYEDSLKERMEEKVAVASEMVNRGRIKSKIGSVRLREWMEYPYGESSATVLKAAPMLEPSDVTFTGTNYQIKSKPLPHMTAKELMYTMRTRMAKGGRHVNNNEKTGMGSDAWQPTKPVDPPKRITSKIRHLKPTEYWLWGNPKTHFTGKTTYPNYAPRRMVSTAPSLQDRKFTSLLPDRDSWNPSATKGWDPRTLYMTNGLRKTHSYTPVHSYL